MPGTLIRKLSSNPGADNTAPAVNGSFTTIGPATTNSGSGGSIVFLAAANMGDLAGYRVSQGPSGVVCAGYLTADARQTIFAARVPLRFGVIPTLADPGTAILRGYSDTTVTAGTVPATIVWTVYLTNTGKVRIVDAGTGATVGVVSTGSLVAGTAYVLELLHNSTANTITVRVSEWGKTAIVATVTTTITGAALGIGTSWVRFGIGNSSSGISYLDTNDSFAVGSDDYLARVDLASLVVSPAASQGSAVLTATGSGGGSGASRTYTLDWGDGSAPIGPQASASFIKTATPPVSVTNLNATLTVNNSAVNV